MRAALLAVASAVLLAGCFGGGADPPAEAGTPTPTPSPAAVAEPRPRTPDLRSARGTATYCVPRYAQRSERRAVADFNARHRGDGLRARFRILPQRAGKIIRLLQRGCDLAHVDLVWIAELAYAGLIADVSDYVARRHEEFLPAALEAVRWEGRDWGVPRSVDTALHFHDANTPPLSWKELYAGARENDGYVYAGALDVPLAIHFLEVAYAAGARVLSPEGDRSEIDSPEALSALELMRSGLNTEAVLPEVLHYDQADALLAFVEERAAYLRDGVYAHEVLKEEDPEGYDESWQVLEPLSFDEGGKPVAVLTGYAVVVAEQARDPDAALALADYLTGPHAAERAARRSGMITPLTAVWDQHFGVFDLWTQIDIALEHARPLPVTPAYTPVMDAIARHVHDALAGRVPPADALRRADREIEAVLSQLREAGGEVS